MSVSHYFVRVSKSAVRWSVVPVVVSGLLLGGCGADDPVDPVSSSTPAVSPSPEPSPTADLTKRPERPAAMDEPTTDGAIAAATYVLELYGYSYATADLRPWRAIALETCEFCTAVVDAVEQMRDAGEASTGSTVTVVTAEATEIDAERWFSVNMDIVQGASTRFDSDGAVVGQGEGGEFNAVFALSWDGEWRVDEMGVERPDPDAADGQ